MSYRRVRNRIQKESDQNSLIDNIKKRIVIKKIELYDSKSLENEIKNQYGNEDFNKIFDNNRLSQIHYRVLLYILRDFSMKKVIREEEINLGQTTENEINNAASDIEKYLECEGFI